jgi:hypothetical protein
MYPDFEQDISVSTEEKFLRVCLEDGESEIYYTDREGNMIRKSGPDYEPVMIRSIEDVPDDFDMENYHEKLLAKDVETFKSLGNNCMCGRIVSNFFTNEDFNKLENFQLFFLFQYSYSIFLSILHKDFPEDYKYIMESGIANRIMNSRCSNSSGQRDVLQNAKKHSWIQGEFKFNPNRETIEKVRNYVFNYFYEASKVKMKTRQTLSFDYQKVLKVLQEDKDCEIPSDFTYAYKTKIHS